jgi:DNA-binding transcriptional MocR family regulator
MTTQVAGYVSKTDMVTALIRELLMTSELGPGEQLRQRDLAQRFGVGQTPVREAMRRLESEGPLGCDTHRGFTVVVADLGRVAVYEYAHSPLLLSLMRLLWASLHGGPRVSLPSLPGSTTRSWPRSPEATPAPPPLGHISTSWARIR